MVAIFLQHVAVNHLYLKPSLRTNSLKDYAAHHAGIQLPSALTRAKGAGAAARTFYPDLCEQVLDYLAGFQNSEIPKDLPAEYLLDLLGQAAKPERGNDEATIQRLAEGVRDGKVNVGELRACAKKKKSAVPAPDDAVNDSAEQPASTAPGQPDVQAPPAAPEVPATPAEHAEGAVPAVSPESVASAALSRIRQGIGLISGGAQVLWQVEAAQVDAALARQLVAAARDLQSVADDLKEALSRTTGNTEQGKVAANE